MSRGILVGVGGFEMFGVGVGHSVILGIGVGVGLGVGGFWLESA